MSGLGAYKAFQIAGEKSSISTPEKAYSLTVRNMNYLTYIACPATVRFSTQNINFGPLLISQAAVNTVASKVELTLFATRRCSDDTVFSMNAYMRPAAVSSISPGDKLLIPQGSDNKPFDSVGLELLRNGECIPFNQEFPMFDASNKTSREQRLEANLIWRTNQPKTGTFNGGLIMEFFHQ